MLIIAKGGTTVNKTEKKIISFSLVIAIVFCILSAGISAYAKAQRLILDVMYSDALSGNEDLIWYIYTPEVSGTYSFLSFNVPHSEAYLFTKESNSDQTQKVMTQLAYSSLSPDYAARGQGGIIQFCLTYHLEAGTTYYYAAGWWSSERTGGTMNVKLTCDEYDDVSIEKIDLSSSVSFEENTNGSWMTDSSGDEYYSYNYSRIISNLTVKLTYKDGTVSTVIGKDEIDGHPITYSVNQSEEHWYPESNANYTGNVITVTVLGVSAEYNAVITESSYKTARLKVVDYSTGVALSGVTLECENQSAVTDSSGYADLSVMNGENTVTVSDDFAIKRTLTVVVNTEGNGVDLSSNAIGLVTGDYCIDGVINGKDYAYVLKNFRGDTLTYEKIKFKKQANFKESSYPNLILGQ